MSTTPQQHDSRQHVSRVPQGPARAATAGRFPETVWILPWPDAKVDQRGHDPRSRYVELFWLGVLGPSAVWILRRVAEGFDAEPDGFEVDCEQFAGEVGLSVVKGYRSPFAKAVRRCVLFGVASTLGTGTPGWQVRRRLGTVPARHLDRLPLRLQHLHADWDHISTEPYDEPATGKRSSTASSSR